MNISFALTKDQIVGKTKTQTRRIGWRNLKVGAVLTPVNKVMGFKKGERPVRIGDFDIRVTAIRRERLDAITQEEVAKEGYPEMSREEFINRFCFSMKCGAFTEVAVIDFEYLEPQS